MKINWTGEGDKGRCISSCTAQLRIHRLYASFPMSFDPVYSIHRLYASFPMSFDPVYRRRLGVCSEVEDDSVLNRKALLRNAIIAERKNLVFSEGFPCSPCRYITTLLLPTSIYVCRALLCTLCQSAAEVRAPRLAVEDVQAGEHN